MLILIPCKNFDQGKSRLASHLDSPSRRALCERFLCQTLALATSVIPAAQVKVVTGDPRAVEICADYGASSVPDFGTNLNSALVGARRLLLSDRSFELGMLVLPTDLPYATPSAIAAVVAQAVDTVIVPDQDGQGTHLLFLRSGAFRNFPFAFGANSFDRHCEAARSAGHSMKVVRDDRLAFDVDQPRHYRKWRDAPGPAPRL